MLATDKYRIRGEEGGNGWRVHILYRFSSSFIFPIRGPNLAHETYAESKAKSIYFISRLPLSTFGLEMFHPYQHAEKKKWTRVLSSSLGDCAASRLAGKKQIILSTCTTN